jgi:hypothetical protein
MAPARTKRLPTIFSAILTILPYLHLAARTIEAVRQYSLRPLLRLGTSPADRLRKLERMKTACKPPAGSANLNSCNSRSKNASQSYEKKSRKLAKRTTYTCTATRRSLGRPIKNAVFKDCKKSWIN